MKVLAPEHNWAGTIFSDTIARQHTLGLPRIPQPIAPCPSFGSWVESDAARRARAEAGDAVFHARMNLYGEPYRAKKAIQDLERAAGRKSGSGEAALLRKELVKMCRENDRLRRIVKSDWDIMECLLDGWAEIEVMHARKTAEMQAGMGRLEAELGKRGGQCKRLKRRLGRYENRNTPGPTGYNEKRKKLREEVFGTGNDATENRIGPPVGHAGHRNTIPVSKVVRHQTECCPACHSYDLAPGPFESKLVLDFHADARRLKWVRHCGDSAVCPRGHLTAPAFPGIRGTSLGPEALRHILTYATRRSVDSDIAYFFRSLYKCGIAENTIWNARVALSRTLAPSMQYIMERLRAAKFLQLDETSFKYRKRRIYVWIIRCDDAALVLPLLGRGAEEILPYVKDLLDKPVVVDGYVVYPSLFGIIQRCWSHILRDAEGVCIEHEKSPLREKYVELYCRLLKIFRKAKKIAKKTAKRGGADMATCNILAEEVRALAAEYGSLDFATTLSNAADDLFTFLRHPGMPPTNNSTEWDVRDYIVPQRNIRRKFMAQKGMFVFAALQIFAATCDKLGLDPGDSLMKILEYPLHDILEEAGAGRAGEGLSEFGAHPGRPHAMPALPAPPAMPALPAPDTCAAPPAIRAPPQAPARLPRTLRNPHSVLYPAKPDSTVPGLRTRTILHGPRDYLPFHNKPPPLP